MPKKVKVSIIIVKYQCEKYLKDCLSSIGKNDEWEIIVVDNDKENVGFGVGCNKGAKQAKGEYLFFLNPDTIILPKAIERLLSFMEEGADINPPLRCEPGIVAPLLLNQKKQPYPLQGTEKLTSLTALVVFSFLNKYWPDNFVSRKYWLKNWDKKQIKEVGTVPGTAFMIRRKIFEKAGGFDEKLFLYFEEFDLCDRVRKLGWRVFINPQAKIIHFWEGRKSSDKKLKRIFRQSRFYYFKKHWGGLSAIVVESILRSTEWLAQLF